MESAAPFLTRNTAAALPAGELERKLALGRPLRVKLGIDPTAPDIHLGLGNVGADIVLNVDVRWRGADGKLRSQTLQVTPGWHTVWLGLEGI